MRRPTSTKRQLIAVFCHGTFEWKCQWKWRPCRICWCSFAWASTFSVPCPLMTCTTLTTMNVTFIFTSFPPGPTGGTWRLLKHFFFHGHFFIHCSDDYANFFKSYEPTIIDLISRNTTSACRQAAAYCVAVDECPEHLRTQEKGLCDVPATECCAICNYNFKSFELILEILLEIASDLLNIYLTIILILFLCNCNSSNFNCKFNLILMLINFNFIVILILILLWFWF